MNILNSRFGSTPSPKRSSFGVFFPMETYICIRPTCGDASSCVDRSGLSDLKWIRSLPNWTACSPIRLHAVVADPMLEVTFELWV